MVELDKANPQFLHHLTLAMGTLLATQIKLCGQLWESPNSVQAYYCLLTAIVVLALTKQLSDKD